MTAIGRVLFLLTLACLLALPVRAAQTPVPPFTGWVTDTTGTLDAASRQALENQLDALHREKGAQLAVLMVATLGEESVEAYALRAFAQWQLGRGQVDDGVLLVIARDDRRLRIEVGYGLEGAIPDILAGRIIREQITPAFRQGHFAQGIQAGVDSLAALIRGEDLPPPAAQTTDERAPMGALFAAMAFMALIMPVGVPTLFLAVFAAVASGSGLVGLVVGILALVLGLIRQVVFPAANGLASASRRGSQRWGGLGGGGGMGGGFGGGGGGSSGGGGASGSW